MIANYWATARQVRSVLPLTVKAGVGVLFLLIMQITWVHAAETTAKAPTIQTLVESQDAPILVVGDSLSAAYGMARKDGWVALLQEQLSREGYPQRVVNGSISGETTRGGLKRLPEMLSRHQPTVVIIELGSNDGLRGMPLKVMSDNLKEMIKLSQSQGTNVILVGNRIPPNYGRAYTEAFVKVFSDLADQYQIPLVPFFMQDIATNEDLLQADRIHPNEPAQPIMLERVAKPLKALLDAR